MFKHITRTVWLIALISLFNDFSSEMLYPIYPLFLAQIGYSGLFLGFFEGVAECLSGLCKIYMGSVSDTIQKRLPFVQVGYALSILSRPVIALSKSVGIIFVARSSDRIGKGIRSAARDALLADECQPSNRATIFGFHRSMDTLGAIFGPLTAMLFLHFYPENYQTIFFISIIPGIIAILFTFLIKEKTTTTTQTPKVIKPKSLWQHFSYYQQASTPYKQILLPLILFALFNSSDMFLILHAKNLGISSSQTIYLYLHFNLIYAVFAFPIGKLSDKFKHAYMLIIGILLFSIAYFLFALALSTWHLIAAFTLYGLYYAFTQGSIKALLLQNTQPEHKAKAIGLYEGLSSFGLLIANIVAGIMWQYVHAPALFATVGIVSFIVAIVLSVLFFKTKQ